MIIPFKKTPPQEPKCSFCGTIKSQCKALVGNTETGKYICDKCLEICHERLSE